MVSKYIAIELVEPLQTGLKIHTRASSCDDPTWIAHWAIPNVVGIVNTNAAEVPLYFTENIGLLALIDRLQYRLSIEMILDNLRHN